MTHHDSRSTALRTLAALCGAALLGSVLAQPIAHAATSGTVAASVTTKVIEARVDLPVVSLGRATPGSLRTTPQLIGRNAGNVDEVLGVYATDARTSAGAVWQLGTAVGPDTYRIDVAAVDRLGSFTLEPSTVTVFTDTLPAGSSQPFTLELHCPTTTAELGTYRTRVTLVAVEP